MIRLLLLTLVLANLIAFLAWQGTLDAWGPGGTTGAPVSAQVAPERLKVIVPGKAGAPAPGAPAPAEAAGSAGASAASGAPSSPSAPSAPGAAPAGAATGPGAAAGGAPGASSTSGSAPLAAGAAGPMQCLEAGPLDEARVERIRDWARNLPAGLKASIERRAETASFMVYLPPGAMPGDAQGRIDQLRQRGVADLFLIADGPLKSAISLGVFRSQEGARVQVERLAARGVTGTLIAPIPGRIERSWARLTRAPSVADGPWEATRAQLQSVSGIAPGACPVPAS